MYTRFCGRSDTFLLAGFTLKEETDIRTPLFSSRASPKVPIHTFFPNFLQKCSYLLNFFHSFTSLFVNHNSLETLETKYDILVSPSIFYNFQCVYGGSTWRVRYHQRCRRSPRPRLTLTDLIPWHRRLSIETKHPRKGDERKA